MISQKNSVRTVTIREGTVFFVFAFSALFVNPDSVFKIFFITAKGQGLVAAILLWFCIYMYRIIVKQALKMRH